MGSVVCNRLISNIVKFGLVKAKIVLLNSCQTIYKGQCQLYDICIRSNYKFTALFVSRYVHIYCIKMSIFNVYRNIYIYHDILYNINNIFYVVLEVVEA